MSIALVVPVLNQFKMFAELMATVDHEVIPVVVDNWDRNRGVAGGWNHGLDLAEEAGCEYALVSNDDVRFGPGSIRSIHNNLIKHRDHVLVSANQNGQRQGTGLVEGADFFCFGVHIGRLRNAHGRFDENIWPAYFEDNDMHYRIQLRDRYKCAVDQDAYVFHHGSATQNFDQMNPNTTSTRFEAIRSYYVRKWGGTPGQEKFQRPWNNEALDITEWRGHDKVSERNLELESLFGVENG